MFGRGKSRGSGGGRRGPRISPFTVGAIVVALTLVVTYLGFTKDIPLRRGFQIQGVFENANSIRKNSPVRIAGVNVGKVKKIQRQGSSNAAVVTIEIDKKGLPIHKDATLKIRPRIFLEGNFFIDVKPGTPQAPHVSDGDTIPITQTANPVQLDEVLTALQSDAREDLKDVLGALGTGLTYKPAPVDDLGQDTDVQGESAAEALNDTSQYGADSLKGVSLVNQSLLGTEQGDLSKLLAGLSKVSAALDRDEGALQGLISNFNTTVGAFAAESGNLQATIRELAPTLRSANEAFDSLNAAFPPTRAFALEIIPGVRETPATIDASLPWINQTRQLLGPRELQGLARELQPTTARLAALTDRMISFLPQVHNLNRCATNVILPSGDVVLQDGSFTTGVENYKEFWYTMVGLAGEGQNFDGNGMYVRFQAGGGADTVSTGQLSGGTARLFGNAASRPLGTRPRKPARRPPYNDTQRCFTQTIPDYNGPAANIGPAETTIASSAKPRTADAGEQPNPEGSLAEDIISRLNPFKPGAGATPPSGAPNDQGGGG